MLVKSSRTFVSRSAGQGEILQPVLGVDDDLLHSQPHFVGVHGRGPGLQVVVTKPNQEVLCCLPDISISVLMKKVNSILDANNQTKP